MDRSSCRRHIGLLPSVWTLRECSPQSRAVAPHRSLLIDILKKGNVFCFFCFFFGVGVSEDWLLVSPTTLKYLWPSGHCWVWDSGHKQTNITCITAWREATSQSGCFIQRSRKWDDSTSQFDNSIGRTKKGCMQTRLLTSEDLPPSTSSTSFHLCHPLTPPPSFRQRR